MQVQNDEKLTLGFVAYDKNFVIDLYMNKHLLPSHYFEKYQENGSHVTHLPLKNVSALFQYIYILILEIYVKKIIAFLF